MAYNIPWHPKFSVLTDASVALKLYRQREETLKWICTLFVYSRCKVGVGFFSLFASKIKVPFENLDHEIVYN